MRSLKKLFLYISVALVSVLPFPTLAETLSSSNYSVENPSVDVGGQLSNSTNYTSRDSIGGSNDSAATSTNYKIFPGFMQHAYPGVPAQPTLTNTGGVLYNALDFIMATGAGQQTDTVYAIAISSDSFTTTNFIQADDTVGSTAVWQSYISWGSGTGQRVTGLVPNTTYQIKVKARYAADTETAYSLTASATTGGPTLTVSFSGVNSGTVVAGATTTVTSAANSITYGSLTPSVTAVAAQTITVSTNATGGYTTTLQQDGNLRNNNGDAISATTGSNASPAAWPTGITAGYFGYHTTDSSLCTGTTSRFSSNNTYAAATTTPAEIACSTTTAANEQTSIVYKVEVGTLQDAGTYQNIITYITTAQF